VADGVQALYFNTGGYANTAIGYQALLSNTVGFGNTANGYQALFSSTSGNFNTVTGTGALFSNTIGGFNTASGAGALGSNTIGSYNTAIGFETLSRNTTGNRNTANGAAALDHNFSGAQNTAIGEEALSNTTGSNNTALGFGAGANIETGSFNIDIGNSGVFSDNATIRIGTVGTHGNTFIAGIHNVNQGGTPLAVTINANGQLGTQAPSSRRFKKEIKTIDRASEAILSLKPVTFQYKSDNKGTPQFGLIAEEVAEINPDLVVRDENGEIYTVRYDAVNAMLLNEFLKEHRKVEQLTKDFESKLAEQQKQIEALTAGLQKVSVQLEASKPAPQLVNNP
jgi:hypothetical protein